MSSKNKSVIQDWVNTIPMMQQTVLFTAIRGPDGIAKYGSVKMLLRWFRRCILLSAVDGKVLDNPYDLNGGSFTGPSLPSQSLAEAVGKDWPESMNEHVGNYVRDSDAFPHHFQMHFMHAAQILGFKHPNLVIRFWWATVYQRLVNTMHLHPETEAEMDDRLGDDRSGWLRRSDPATTD